jgi:hypothetical protein
MLARIKHLFRRAYAVPSKLDEIIGRLEGIAPVERPVELHDNGVPKNQSPYWHWQSSFDALAMMRKFAAPNLKPTPGFVTNFLGVKVDPVFYPPLLDSLVGTVEPIPTPNNWHADVAEFAAALRAVDLAGDTFTVAELGCGWGCWLNNTGVAAKRVGKKPFLIGIEGDDGHLDFARRSLPDNGFTESEFVLYRGIAAGYDGVALFPRQEQAGGNWGLEPILNPTEDQIARAEEEDSCEILPTIDLATITEKHGDLDLLHIDIQGGETAFLEGCIETCNRSVRYVLVGTHSRIIEGLVETLMFANGWALEMDRPSSSTLDDGVRTLRADGVQGWRNSRFM